MLTEPWGGGLTASGCHHTAPLSDGHPKNTFISQGTVTSQGIVILRLLPIPQGKSPPWHCQSQGTVTPGHCHPQDIITYREL